MTWRWFISKTVRQATDMRKHVWKLLQAQRDLLTPPAIEAIETSLRSLREAIQRGATKAELRESMGALEATATRWLKPYPHAALRENVEVFLVAVAVAMGIRTFFLQPFKIPTGSMQPTLYGITEHDLRDRPDFKIPKGLEAFIDSWFYGVSYYELVAKNDGVLRAGPLVTVFPFVKKQTLYIGSEPHTVWFPPDELLRRAGVHEGTPFRRGQTVIRAMVLSGDHLFVDRLTYNFRRPQRGEIIVFETKGIMGLQQDLFYIKRLVALGGETVTMGADRHVSVDGRRLDYTTPHFEFVYGFDPKKPVRPSEYSGHSPSPRLAPLFTAYPEGVKIRPGHYMVMGDNTENSLDSRAWGDFSQENVIGKYCFVYWPIGSKFGPSRFGWSQR